MEILNNPKQCVPAIDNLDMIITYWERDMGIRRAVLGNVSCLALSLTHSMPVAPPDPVLTTEHVFRHCQCPQNG